MKKLIFFFFFTSIAAAQLSWSPLANAPFNSNGTRFDDVYFLNENLGWAANGYNAAVYKTTNGGVNWTLQTNNTMLGSNHYFRNIEFLNESIGFLGSLNGKFYRTIDGGTTWNLVNITPNPSAICGLDCVGLSTIYGCGAYFSPAFLIKSTDSGVTWQYIDMSSYANALVEVLFINENIGFVAGKNATGAVILKTMDGGNTWSTIYNGTIPGEYVWKLQTLNNQSDVIFGAVESVSPNLGKLIKSIDNGDTWTVKTAPEVDVQAVGFVDQNHGWMGGHTTGFYETTNGGDTWTNTTVGSNLNRIFILNSSLAFASGSTLYKMSNNLAVNQFQERSRKPLEVKIAPNPIKDKLNVIIDFEGEDHLLLELYSSSGQLIKQLKLDEIEGKTSKKYIFDFTYPPGVYYLNIHNNTGRQTVKVIK